MTIKLNVISRDQNKNVIEVEVGTSVRDAIVDKITSDNYGLCGGNAICGTCHVYVSEDDFKKLEVAKEEEVETLGTLTSKVEKNSRLACQVKLTESLNNITVTIAPD